MIKVYSSLRQSCSDMMLLLFELVIFKYSWPLNFHPSLEYLLPDPQKTRDKGNPPKNRFQEPREMWGMGFSNFHSNQWLCKPPFHQLTRRFFVSVERVIIRLGTGHATDH